MIKGHNILWNQDNSDFIQIQNTIKVYNPYNKGIRTRPTKNFQVAKTSLPAILTLEEANASFAFFVLMALAMIAIGRLRIDL